jgi:hypothetical protein
MKVKVIVGNDEGQTMEKVLELPDNAFEGIEDDHEAQGEVVKAAMEAEINAGAQGVVRALMEKLMGSMLPDGEKIDPRLMGDGPRSVH